MAAIYAGRIYWLTRSGIRGKIYGPHINGIKNLKKYPDMRRVVFILAVTLLPMAVWGQTDDDLPYVDVKKDAAGKYGYYYENGDCLLPPLFDWALQFGLGDRATAVKYMDLYYIIDREGYLILPTGFEDMPDVYKNFAVVGEEGKRYVIDLQGNRLSPEGWSVEPLERSHADPLFFAMTPVGDETGGAYLADFRFEPLSEVRATSFRHMIYCPEVFEYNISDGVLSRYGLMNADGDVLIPADTYYLGLSEKSLWSLDGSYELVHAAGMEGLYDEEDKERTIFVEATKGNITTLYDVTGEVVVPAQKHTTESKYYKRNTKKYLVPYLHALSDNKERYEERVDDAFRRSTWFEPKAAPTPREYSMVASIEQHERQQQEELEREREIERQREAYYAAERERAAQSDASDSADDNSGGDDSYASVDALASVWAMLLGVDFSGGEQVKLSSYVPKEGTLPTNLEIYYMSEQGGFLHIVIMDIGGYPCVSITDIAGNDLFMSIKQPEKRRDDFLFAGEDEYKYKTLSIRKDWSSVTLGDKTYEMVMTADEVQDMLKLLGQ